MQVGYGYVGLPKVQVLKGDVYIDNFSSMYNYNLTYVEKLNSLGYFMVLVLEQIISQALSSVFRGKKNTLTICSAMMTFT